MTNIVPLIHFPAIQQRQDISQAIKAGTVNAEKDQPTTYAQVCPPSIVLRRREEPLPRSRTAHPMVSDTKSSWVTFVKFMLAASLTQCCPPSFVLNRAVPPVIHP